MKDKTSYNNNDHDKTEFLFESDAEKAALNEATKPKKTKLYKKIIINCIIISFMIIGGFYSFNILQINKLNASIIKSNSNKTNEEKMNKSSDNLEIIKNNKNKYELIINKSNPLDEYTLNNYVIVDVYNNAFDNIKLEKKTFNEYIKLKANLLERGYFINIKSGYRTFDESNEIYNYYKEKNGLDYAEKYVAKPGISEHNAGIAFDFTISDNKSILTTDYKSDEYLYLEKIAYLYGFIIRYPKGKENITGYQYEPWHLRYVGKDLAKYLTKNNLTLEEYYKTKE